MNKIYYKWLCIFLCILPMITATGATNRFINSRYSEEKKIQKEFSVNDDALLKIKNSYGNLTISSWEENTIVFEILIKVQGNDREKVLNKLNTIDVLFKHSTSSVNATTVFENNEKSWWNKLVSNQSDNHLKMEIHYNVKVPITNNVHLSNTYGAIILDKLKGNATVYCDYGQIVIGELLSATNIIDIEYTNNSSIQWIEHGKIKADYSDFSLKKGKTITLNANYTTSKVGSIEKIDYYCDYAQLQIEEAAIIHGHGEYLLTRIGSISDELKIVSDYGSLDIKELKETTQNVTIDTDYTGVQIGYAPIYDFKFLLESNFGGIDLDDNVVTTKKNETNFKKIYEGYNGTANSTNFIKIQTNYGNILLKKN